MYNLNKLLLIFLYLMTESQILKLPLTSEMFDELEEIFVGEKETAHDFVWGLVRKLCKDAKMGKLAKQCTVNSFDKGQQIQKQIKLKGLELEEVPSDPDWLPDQLEKDDVTYFEHKITDKTFKYLKLYCQFAVLRHTEYAKGLESENNRKLQSMRDGNAKPEMLADAEENFKTAVEKFLESTPKSMEEILYTAIYPTIHQHVAQAMDAIFDKENEEMYPKEEKPSK